MNLLVIAVPFCAIAILVYFAYVFRWPGKPASRGALARREENPILSPVEHSWENAAVFNPGAILMDGKVHLFYRALGADGISRIGYAVSDDGVRFERFPDPAFALALPSPGRFRNPFAEGFRYDPGRFASGGGWGGSEDPRVVFFEGRYVIFYTALGGYPFNAGNIRVGVAFSKDLSTIDEKHLVTPFNAKAMTLFPKRVNGKVTAVLTVHTDEPPTRIAVVQCENIEDLWDEAFWEHWHEKLPEHALNPVRRDSDHVEVGAPPLLTKDGWLLLYSYAQNYLGGGDRVFGIEAVLLDKKDPRAIIGRTKGPIISPEEIYERYGTTENVVFPSGALLADDGRLDIYYGAADSVCASASLYLPDLLEAMEPAKRSMLAARAKGNPLIERNAEHPWEKKAVFNAGAVDVGGTPYLLYRAMSDDNTSVLGFAEMAKNGLSVKERLVEPAYVPRAEFELKKGDARGNSGCEDPRITKIGPTLYVGYTAYDGVRPPRAALTSISAKDFVAKRFDRFALPQSVTPDGIDDKDMCVFPSKIKGKYCIFHRVGDRICADFRDTLDFSNERITRCIEVMGPRPGMWDSKKIGIAGVPFLTPKGWLLVYHGISSTTTYRLGAALLDKDDPTHVIARTVDPILEPVESYEREGQVAHVVFSCGAIVRGDSLIIYYGGADTVIGAAAISLKRLLSILEPNCLSGSARKKRA